MKLAIFGAVVAVAGLLLGVDGLVFSGGLWLVMGFLAWTLITRHRANRSAGRQLLGADAAEVGRIEGSGGQENSPSWLGLGLLLVIGFGSLAIGFFEVGFTGDNESLRWLPLGVGILVTALAVLTIPARMGVSSASVAAAEGSLTPGDPDQESEVAIDRDAPVERDRGGDSKERLEKLEELRRSDLISQEEYEVQRERILESI